MPRARNIKYAFFENDELADLHPLARLLFIGMWTIADYKGDFEWRERKIKTQILPYDECNISEFAINLDKSGFIRFYSDGEKIYCQIVNFNKHQHPHKNEHAKGSNIPLYTEDMRQLIDFKGLKINLDKSGLKRCDSASDRADSFNPIPDSFNPIPDSPPNPQGGKVKQRIIKSDEFKNLFMAYPVHRKGGTDKTAWNLWKRSRLTSGDAKDAMSWIILAATNDPETWGKDSEGLFCPGITKFISEELWHKPVPSKRSQGDHHAAHKPTCHSRGDQQRAAANELISLLGQPHSTDGGVVGTHGRPV